MVLIVLDDICMDRFQFSLASENRGQLNGCCVWSKCIIIIIIIIIMLYCRTIYMHAKLTYNVYTP